jgi:hypothetical protein
MTDSPVPELHDTEWLTDARDAEPGMKVVAFDRNRGERLTQRIEAVQHGHKTILLLETGGAIDADRINQTAAVVVETDATEDEQ